MNVISICTPTRDTVNAGFAFDLVGLVKHSPQAVFTVSQGTYLSNLRSLLVRTSIEHGVSHILFLDSDMRFPPDALERLLKHDVDIVGANYMQRVKRESTAWKNGQFVYSEGKTGLEEVDTLGFGVTLIKAEVFKTIPEPWFAMPWDGEKLGGEDIYFCTIAKSHGFKVYIDHDLKVKHSKMIEFGMEGY